MQTTTLGRTGFQVSRMGLGCGGHSRLGLRTPGNEENAVRLVKEALDLGINFIDTAEAYGTERVVGQGIAGTPRDQVFISTKTGVTWDERKATSAELREKLEGCLKRLGTDYVDVFNLHGVLAADYAYCRDELVPTMLALKDEGKIRSIGITEAFIPEPGHDMLAAAGQNDDCWDVVMVGFNLINQSARDRVLAFTQEKKIGTLCMFAVRRALSQPEALKELVNGLIQSGQLSVSALDFDEPLGFLSQHGISSSLQEAAYRYCLWEPGMDVILSGTGSIEHLRENAASLSKPPLPKPIVDHLAKIFAKVDSVSGN